MPLRLFLSLSVSLIHTHTHSAACSAHSVGPEVSGVGAEGGLIAREGEAKGDKPGVGGREEDKPI